VTPGQIWTTAIGLVVAALLLGFSLPPVLDQRNAPTPTTTRTP